MTQQIIDVGSAVNDGTGDPARTAFTKSNDNFTELYAADANFPAGAWTAWSPTISASVGSITSTTINAARYTKAGKAITAFFDITITNAGTGGGFLQISLPVTMHASGGGFAVGVEIGLTGSAIVGRLQAASSTTLAFIQAYDGTTMVVTNVRVIGTMMYESA